MAGSRVGRSRRPAPASEQRTGQACANVPPRHMQVRRWDSANGQSVARGRIAFKSMLRWKLRRFDVPAAVPASASHSHAALSQHPQPRRHRAGRGRVRSRAQRPDRRDRRRQIHPRRGRRPAARGPRVDRPGPHGRRHRRDRSACSNDATAESSSLRREVTAQGRSRAFVNGALATAGGAARSSLSVSIELHGQHEHQVLLDPDTHLDLLDALRRSATARAPRWPTAFDACAARSDANCEASQLDERAEGGANRPAHVPARRDRSARDLRPGEDDELRRHAPGARERRAAAAAERRGVRGALRSGRRRARRA